MPRELKQLVETPDLQQKYTAAFLAESKLRTVWAFFFCGFLLSLCEVGFSFIRAHSEGLFAKGPATQLDMALNAEARVSRFPFALAGDLCSHEYQSSCATV